MDGNIADVKIYYLLSNHRCHRIANHLKIQKKMAASGLFLLPVSDRLYDSTDTTNGQRYRSRSPATNVTKKSLTSYVTRMLRACYEEVARKLLPCNLGLRLSSSSSYLTWACCHVASGRRRDVAFISPRFILGLDWTGLARQAGHRDRSWRRRRRLSIATATAAADTTASSDE